MQLQDLWAQVYSHWAAMKKQMKKKPAGSIKMQSVMKGGPKKKRQKVSDPLALAKMQDEVSQGHVSFANQLPAGEGGGVAKAFAGGRCCMHRELWLCQR